MNKKYCHICGYIAASICRGATYIYASLRGWYNTLYMFMAYMVTPEVVQYFYYNFYAVINFYSLISRQLRRSNSPPDTSQLYTDIHTLKFTNCNIRYSA